ncbi:four helix bundle protein [bacterium]|nr:four helix bundle protein [bacterium]
MITSYRELRVYRNAKEGAMVIFRITENFPTCEKYSMVDQMRRSSRSVCTNIAEGWRKRRYRAAFIAKLSDAESEACETQVWLDFALSCGYLDKETTSALEQTYEKIMGQIVLMIERADQWLIKESPRSDG